MRTEPILVENIIVGRRHRSISDDAVARLAESMKTIGLMTPITVHSPSDDSVWLVAGHHRLAAAKLLGWEEIDAFVVDASEIDLEMREIAENLHRSELTALERDEQIGRWAELLAARAVQVGPPPTGPSDKGIRKVARDLGIARADAIRAVKVASLSEEAKEAARSANLDDNRSALLAAASEDTPEKQVAKISELAAAKIARPQRIADDPLNDPEATERQVVALMSAWNKAGPEAREQFMSRIERPVMDIRYARG